ILCEDRSPHTLILQTTRTPFVLHGQGKAYPTPKLSPGLRREGPPLPASPADCQPSPLRLQLLGPFEVAPHGRPLPRLRSPKSLWLLALLVLRRGATVERDWLSGLLWPGRDDQQGLRNSLTELRRAMGTEAERLRRREIARRLTRELP